MATTIHKHPATPTHAHFFYFSLLIPSLSAQVIRFPAAVVVVASERFLEEKAELVDVAHSTCGQAQGQKQQLRDVRIALQLGGRIVRSMPAPRLVPHRSTVLSSSSLTPRPPCELSRLTPDLPCPPSYPLKLTSASPQVFRPETRPVPRRLAFHRG